jgi:hypothetical protein
MEARLKSIITQESSQHKISKGHTKNERKHLVEKKKGDKKTKIRQWRISER